MPHTIETAALAPWPFTTAAADAPSGAPLPPADPAARLAALRATALLDTPAEQAFDRLTRLAARLIGVPTALVSLVDEDRQFFKSCVGLPEPWASVRETPLSHSFCQHAVALARPLVIEDARTHPLVRDNLAIRDIGVIAYAGIPLATADGDVLGSFCVIDGVPRQWTADELATLTDLAAAVMTEIELRTAPRRGGARRGGGGDPRQGRPARLRQPRAAHAAHRDRRQHAAPGDGTLRRARRAPDARGGAHRPQPAPPARLDQPAARLPRRRVGARGVRARARGRG
jgi:GAF domain-containing protein